MMFLIWMIDRSNCAVSEKLGKTIRRRMELASKNFLTPQRSSKMRLSCQNAALFCRSNDHDEPRCEKISFRTRVAATL
jgi:hypothetical protein